MLPYTRASITKYIIEKLKIDSTLRMGIRKLLKGIIEPYVYKKES